MDNLVGPALFISLGVVSLRSALKAKNKITAAPAASISNLVCVKKGPIAVDVEEVTLETPPGTLK